MSRIFITGSTDGLGHAAARTLIDEGHEVLFHARSQARTTVLSELASQSLGIVIGDLGSSAETHKIAEQVNAFGRFDVIIHNAGVYRVPTRSATAEGHARTLAVNTLAPYLLTAETERPRRLIYLSSGVHRNGSSSLRDVDWVERHWDETQAYCDNKLYLTALSVAVARLWPDVLSNAVDPGWVPTKMGGAGATDDLEKGHLTQTWLAISDDPAVAMSGRYWYHRQVQAPASTVANAAFQERLIDTLGQLTGVSLF